MNTCPQKFHDFQREHILQFTRSLGMAASDRLLPGLTGRIGGAIRKQSEIIAMHDDGRGIHEICARRSGQRNWANYWAFRLTFHIIESPDTFVDAD